MKKKTGTVIEEWSQGVGKIVKKYIGRKDIAGAVVMINEDFENVYFKTFGYRDVVEKSKMSKNTIFQIKSMTKPITAVACLILEEQKRLSLDDEIEKHLPEMKNLRVLVDRKYIDTDKKVTIKHLLTHTSGFSYGSMYGDKKADKLFDKANIWRDNGGGLEYNKKFLKKLSKVPLKFQPGTRFSYGVNFEVLGMLIERVVGTTLGVFMEKFIFNPLGMNETTFVCPMTKMNRMASVYGPKLKLVEKYQKIDHFASWAPKYRPHLGGALASTASDYMKFGEMLLNKGVGTNGKRVLSENSVVEMTRMNHLPQGVLAFDYYGFGYGVYFEINDKSWCSYGEFGWDGMYSTHFWAQPRMNRVCLVLTQTSPFIHDIKDEIKKVMGYKKKVKQ